MVRGPKNRELKSLEKLLDAIFELLEGSGFYGDLDDEITNLKERIEELEEENEDLKTD